MTVLGGARQLPAGARPLPGAIRVRPVAGARPVRADARRRVSARQRAGRRSHPVGLLLAVVIVAFMLGLMYLGQTIQLAAINYQTSQAIVERDDIYRQIQTVETSVLSWGTEPVVLERAQRLGLDRLPSRVRLAAR